MNYLLNVLTPSPRIRGRNASALAALLVGGVLWAAGQNAWAADPTVQKVTVRAVAHFPFDRSVLSPDDQGHLLSEVGAMKDVNWQTVTATGYTDSVGTPGYNEALSQRRAAAVKIYLTGKGLPPTLVRTAARGETAPVASNDSEPGRAENRRTEVVFEGVRTR